MACLLYPCVVARHKQKAPFLPHNTPCRLFLVPRRWRRMKDRPQRKECGSCCGLRGSWASRCGDGVSAFSHWVAPGVHESRSAVGGGVKGGENECLWARALGVREISYVMRTGRYKGCHLDVTLPKISVSVLRNEDSQTSYWKLMPNFAKVSFSCFDRSRHWHWIEVLRNSRWGHLGLC